MKIKGPKELVEFIDLVDLIQSIRDGIKQHFRDRMRQSGCDITVEMLEVMVLLNCNEGMNQQEIAGAVRKNKASLTSLIDNLASRGLVERQADANDRRNNIISLTAEGKRYNDMLQPVIMEFYEKVQKGFEHINLCELNQTLRELKSKLSDGSCSAAK